MKIRVGFVSNSSSSSFVCFGWKIETEEQFDNLCNKLEDDTNIGYFSQDEGLFIGIGCMFDDDDWLDDNGQDINLEAFISFGKENKLSSPQLFSGMVSN